LGALIPMTVRCETSSARGVGYGGHHDEADGAVATIESAGGSAVAAQADVADEQAVAALFDVAESTYGGVDVVVHAAGRMSLSPIVDLDLAELDAIHRTNIRGTFVVNQAAARRLRDGGSIVNFSTSVVGLAFPTYGAYSASKGRSGQRDRDERRAAEDRGDLAQEPGRARHPDRHQPGVGPWTEPLQVVVGQNPA
jgi:NAD(P)-dependent dehydrogenase (short-subunit alcohol dehydrogenase family)